MLGFFKWLKKREQIPVPDFPECDFELGWRNIIDLELQQEIIAEVKRISYHINPKDMDRDQVAGHLYRHPPERAAAAAGEGHQCERIFCVAAQDDQGTRAQAGGHAGRGCQPLQIYAHGTARCVFFRHVKGNGAVKPGGQFGKDYLYKWWKKACRNLKVEGVDLYGGTRHSTATALGEHFSRQEIMTAGSMHKTNKAALRYIQAEKNKSILVYRKVREMQGKVVQIGKRKTG